MSRRWRWVTAISIALIPIGAWLTALEVWWAYQGRKAAASRKGVTR